MPLRPALFLDRDGVLIENRPDYVRTLNQVVFIPGAAAALARFHRTCPDWRVVIVSNQAGVGRGLITRETVDSINAAVLHTITVAGGRIDAVYVCPHRVDEVCECRKPKPGLLLQAAREWDIDLSTSIMIGDSAIDMQAARAVGVRPIFVQTGLLDRLPAERAAAVHLQATVYANIVEAVTTMLNSTHINAP
ncbi:MAG: D-glycero-alpha-D-manno-heptose-1,7-bisphosphate 7-phosphatase [Anaerolineales bacterium]